MGKEMVIHIDHQPIQFIQLQGTFWNDHHQKWSTHLQQFHFNIKYKNGNTNNVIDCLNQPLVMALITVLDSSGHETLGWLHLYKSDLEFGNIYQILLEGKYCDAYTISKPTIKKQGLYTPLPTPSRPWESISMDYMSGLPSTKHNNDCVFVVINRFSKMAIMAACKKSITTKAIAKFFFERVWVHFGIPHSIVSDRDNRFLSAFWSSL
eukprot:PITA_21428